MLELFQKGLSLYIRILFWYSLYPNYSNICFSSNCCLVLTYVCYCHNTFMSFLKEAFHINNFNPLAHRNSIKNKMHMPIFHINLAFRFLFGLVPSTQTIYCIQNKYTSISIHTFVRYAKEVSGYKAMHWFSLFRRKTTSAFIVRASIFLKR